MDKKELYALQVYECLDAGLSEAVTAETVGCTVNDVRSLIQSEEYKRAHKQQLSFEQRKLDLQELRAANSAVSVLREIAEDLTLDSKTRASAAGELLRAVKVSKKLRDDRKMRGFGPSTTHKDVTGSTIEMDTDRLRFALGDAGFDDVLQNIAEKVRK